MKGEISLNTGRSYTVVSAFLLLCLVAVSFAVPAWAATDALTVTPSTGPLEGGQRVTITGTDFIPETTSYSDNGLILHYDGIQNSGTGAAAHADNATVWKDLSGHSHDATVVGSPEGNWSDNSFRTNGADYFVSSNFGNQNLLTVQVALTIPDSLTGQASSLSFNGDATHLTARGLWQSATAPFGQPYSWWGNSPATVYQFTGLTRSFGPQLLTLVYDADAGLVKLKVNDGLFYSVEVPADNLGSLYNLVLGRLTNAAISDYEYYSVRVYDRELSADEITDNYQTDVARFFTVPTVTFGDQAATDVVVLDATTLTCLTPPHAKGSVEVSVNRFSGPLTLSDGYRYYSSNAMVYTEESCGTCHYGNVHTEHLAAGGAQAMACSTCHTQNFGSGSTEVRNWSRSINANAFSATQSCGIGDAACHDNTSGTNQKWHGLDAAALSAKHAVKQDSSCGASDCHNNGSSASNFWFGTMDVASAHNDYYQAVVEHRTSEEATVTEAITDTPFGCGICHDKQYEDTLKPAVRAAQATADFSCQSCHDTSNTYYPEQPDCKPAG
jgi:hypothetical protein